MANTPQKTAANFDAMTKALFKGNSKPKPKKKRAKKSKK
jgi:hypothetical protein